MDMKEQSDTDRFREAQLPKYSSERFYLLSVIQHKDSDLIFASVSAHEAATKGYVVPERPEEPSPLLKVVCVYLLVTLGSSTGDSAFSCDTSTGASKAAEAADSQELKPLMDRVERIMHHSAVTYPSGLEVFLEVDVLAPGRRFTAGLNFARQALRAIDSLYGEEAAAAMAETPSPVSAAPAPAARLVLTGRAVSVSDHPACCPGLDRVAEQLASKLPRGALRVVCEAREQLMGSLPDEDPDAVQGVQQWELGDLKPSKRSAHGVARDQGWGAVHASETATSDDGFLSRLSSWVLNLFMFVLFVGTLWSQLPEAAKISLRDSVGELIRTSGIAFEL